jgi:hypothetical protein
LSQSARGRLGGVDLVCAQFEFLGMYPWQHSPCELGAAPRTGFFIHLTPPKNELLIHI